MTHILRKQILAALALLPAWIALTGCANTAPVPSLFERLGGMPALTAAADKTIDRSAGDPRTRRSFEGVKLAPLKESLAEQLCQATGGPCKFEGASMAKVHQDLGITSAEFDALVEQLVATLDQFKVGAREKNDLLQILGPMKSEVVTK